MTPLEASSLCDFLDGRSGPIAAAAALLILFVCVAAYVVDRFFLGSDAKRRMKRRMAEKPRRRLGQAVKTLTLTAIAIAVLIAMPLAIYAREVCAA